MLPAVVEVVLPAVVEVDRVTCSSGGRSSYLQ